MQSRYLFFIAAAFFFGSCKKFLDVKPKDEYTATQQFSTKRGFYAASTGVYDGIASANLYGQVMTYQAMDILAKRYAVIAANNSHLALSQNNYPLVSNTFTGVWSEAYKVIMSSNILIDNIKAQKDILTQDESDILHGEMLTARAFLHFDMLRLFGPRWENNAATLSIPYSDQAKVSVLPLLSFETVIEKIIADLEAAETLLAKDPVITQGPMASAPTGNQSVQLRYRQFRFNYFSTIALKARVYLYAGKKPEALATAKRLLADPNLHQHFPAADPNKLLANNINPDRILSSEVLTGVYVPNRDEAFSRYFSSETAGNSFLQPYEQFLTRLFAFGFTGAGETQDYRYQSQWEPASAVGAKGHVFTKYKPITQPADAEYFYSRMIPLIRLSEVYYIAAESEPNAVEGFAWLNHMRPRRGLTPIDPSQYNTLAAQFPKLLANEYLREFYGEGQAFYFFKRTAYRQQHENGLAFAVFNYTEAAYRAPLPLDELK